ncbi:hypothetical protein ACTRW9_10190 [Nitrospina sp. 32_T5]|uniref:hypothetical protein n=1 Tax=unclassified Nitrospina TaxID=2638683 RepID=UPI003F99FB80
MFLKFETAFKRNRVYRDVRVLFYPVALVGLWFMAIAVFNPEGTRGDAVTIFLMGLGVPLFLGYILRWLLHGSITLDDKRGVLEFSESWNLNRPQWSVRRDEIDRVGMKYYSPGAGNHLTSNGGYRLELGVRRGGRFENRILDLFFPDYRDCEKAAKWIGRFAGRPAYDDENNLVYEPDT